jgi:hypothetical protein
MRVAVIVLLSFALVPSAFAQSYVAGLIGADVVRSSVAETTAGPLVVTPPPTATGEPLSGALRVGTFLGGRWGVELEFARTANIDRETTARPPFNILATDLVSQLSGFVPGGVQTIGQPIPTIFPPITIETRYRLRENYTTLSPTAWITQTFGDSFELAYLGGVAFTRARSTFDLTITRITATAPTPIVLPPPTGTTLRRTIYDVTPVAGVEGRFALTEHVRLLAGLRAQGLTSSGGSGWAIRPSVGLGWVSR